MEGGASVLVWSPKLLPFGHGSRVLLAIKHPLALFLRTVCYPKLHICLPSITGVSQGYAVLNCIAVCLQLWHGWTLCSSCRGPP